MNKKILFGIVALAIAGVSVVNVNFNSQSNNLSGVSLANVEALAQESGGGDDCYTSSNNTCGYVVISNTGNYHVIEYGRKAFWGN
ncbi:hypothetical protein FACS189426_23180 [Bacteroidia bacterium]|nr:hypothetical protein FACS189426_23180 [Bacteroidia bacterium]